jgi:hypothetical protein
VKHHAAILPVVFEFSTTKSMSYNVEIELGIELFNLIHVSYIQTRLS